MVRLIDVPVGEDLLDRAVEEAVARGLDGLAVVFPSKRAVHHFAKKLARSLGGPCLPPGLFSLEGFVAYLAGVQEDGMLAEADAAFLLRDAVLQAGADPHLESLARDFGAFYPWGLEWCRALDELDRELVPDSDLRRLPGVEAFEALGPWSRAFYGRLPDIRAAYRKVLAEAGGATRGVVVATALRRVREGTAEVPERLLFAGLFALTRGERTLLEALGKSSDAAVLRHHDGRPWKAFREMEEAFDPGRAPYGRKAALPPIHLHCAPSAHGEVLAAGDLLHGEGVDLSRTAVVLPDPGSLMPLLWEVMGGLDCDYNLTMGYPLTRTPVYALLDQVLRTSEGESQGRVRTADYLALLLHPYVKNLDVGDGTTLRIFAHAVQETLVERGDPFIDPSVLEGDRELAERAERVAGGSEEGKRLLGALSGVHEAFLRSPRGASTLEALARALLEVLRKVSAGSPARYHPFYEEFFDRAVDCLASLAELRAARERLDDRALLHQLVRVAFEEARVPFNGLPLEGLQVMGVLETQTLSFDTVVVLDANEEVLPALSRSDPALPPPFRIALGLPGHAERVEVAKHHVFRLVEAAKEVHVIYRETPDAQRSPFVEQLVFEVERAAGRSGVLVPRPLAFRSSATPEEAPVAAKDETLLKRLEAMPYSSSALDAYLQCPMKFYLGFAVGLREPEGVDEELDVLAVGRRLHEVLSGLFQPLTGGPLTADSYERLLEELPSALLREFPGKGEQALVRRLAQRRLRELLQGERDRLAPDSELAGVEVRLAARLECGGKPLDFKGYADRIERRGGGWTITDFKSGRGLKSNLPRIERVDPRAGRLKLHESIRSFQLPLYVELLHRQEGHDYAAVQARLVSLRSPEEEPAQLFAPEADRASCMRSVLLPALEAVTAEILDPERPFEADPARPSFCGNCAFATICRRTGRA